MTGQYGLLSPVWAGTSAAAATSDDAVIVTLLQVEAAWARTLAEAELAPSESAEAIRSIWQQQQDPDTAAIDPQSLAAAGVGGGNPVIPLLKEIRQILAAQGDSDAALHRGATSQDILDTALNLIIRRVSADTIHHTLGICDSLAAQAQTHRGTLCAARSLTQYALPTTFGLRAAGWLDGVQQAVVALRNALDLLPLQWGGAVGTQASLTEWHGASRAEDLTRQLADQLGVPVGRPWHSQRQPLIRVASALSGLIAALGKIAGDVLLLQRPEFGELREPATAGKGGSSAMPQKQNPVLSVLIRSAALSAPGLLSTLHASAAAAQDERPDGAWHTEWPAITELLRLAGGATAHAAELLSSLEVFPEQMLANLDAAGEALLSERLMLRIAPLVPGGKKTVQKAVQRAVGERIPLRPLIEEHLRSAEPNPARDAALEGLDALFDPADYLGRAEQFVDQAIQDYEAIRGT